MGKEEYLAFHIKSLNNQIKRLMEKSAIDNNDANLTGMQYAMLRFLEEQRETRDIYQRDIEAEFNIRRSTASEMVKGLEKAGLIRRESVPEDARLKKLILTHKAQELHKIAKKHVQQVNQRLTKNITEDELQLFYSILNKIEENTKE